MRWMPLSWWCPGTATVCAPCRTSAASPSPCRARPRRRLRSPGALTGVDGTHSDVLTAAQLAALPSETLQVTFQAGTAPQSHTEIGPSLGTVLRAAHVRSGLNTWVAGVGSDAYVAVVTPAEQWVGERPLQISLNEDGTALAEPRLVVDGDVKGGRYGVRPRRPRRRPRADGRWPVVVVTRGCTPIWSSPLS